MRTATVTWISYHNFGTFLQAYALQQVINKLGFSNAIIDDKRVVMPKGAQYDYIKKLNFIKQAYIYTCIFLNEHQRKSWFAYREYEKFAKRYLDIDNDYQTFDDLNNKYDVFIAGSDQIWYPSEDIFNPYFYLDFVSKKKISYAASIGISEYPEDYKDKVKKLLRDFSHISVREEIGQHLLEEFLHKDIETVLDPTLLLEKRDWDKIASQYKISSHPYLLCYMLTYNEKYLSMARSYANKHNLRLIIIATEEIYKKYADKLLYAGPSKFITAIRNADTVLTDSFHGTVFSIIYHKRFATFKRFRDNAKRNQNTRIFNLFKITGIKGHLINQDEEKISDIAPIDYDLVDNIIKDYRLKSVSYLKDSILY